MEKYNIKKFIEKAREVHGDKYDYSKAVYINAKTKICIICPEHGEFWQTPDKHIQGHNCIYCNNKVKPTLEEYILKANKKHNDKYDYSKTIYKNKNSKICIICHEKDENGIEHGEFWQNAHNHLNGDGCPKCSKKYRYSTDEFIEKAREVHGDKYDYSKVEYINSKTKICIICNKKSAKNKTHGEFWQTPYHHLYGNGCPKCNQSKLEGETIRFLDEHNIKYIYQANKKVLPWLGRQSLDFYLPDYKMAIECQGEQHFKPVDFAGKGKEWANERFNLNKKQDKRKKILCKENKVNILYLNYNENINIKLSNYL